MSQLSSQIFLSLALSWGATQSNLPRLSTVCAYWKALNPVAMFEKETSALWWALRALTAATLEPKGPKSPSAFQEAPMWLCDLQMRGGVQRGAESMPDT